jgi:hypothetical protein
LYLKIFVLLLADIFENYRALCLLNYKLDTAFYFISAGLAWDAALRYTRARLDLLEDYDMHLMIENGIRGGIAQCCKRYSEAKNLYLGKEGDTYIMYLDMNNLYGGSHSQCLPTGVFEWTDPNTSGHILDMKDVADIGYIFEVDVDYPEELHGLHADLPLLAEHFEPPGSTQTKLCTTLKHKKKYVVHYVALKQALGLGLKLTKIQHVIKYNQSPRLRPYIEMNNLLRRGALNEFKYGFFKDMVNIINGKMMEQVRKRLRVQLALSEEEVRKLMAISAFLDRTVYAENVVAVHVAKEKIPSTNPFMVVWLYWT